MPAVQFRRSLNLRRLALLALSLAIIISAPTAGVFSSGDEFSGPRDTDGDGSGDEFSGPRDTDGDGLINKIESEKQTDGDYPLAKADENQKDLYIQVYVGDGIQPLTSQERADLQEIWANMPVSNPDDEMGINLHITQVQLSQSITTNLDTESLQKQEDQLYTRRVPETAQCSVYAVILANTKEDPVVSGRGAAPGYVSVINGQETQRYSTEYTVRSATITHELLHNIVGKFEDGSLHTTGGWLNGEFAEHGTQFYMSNKTASRLSQEGFAESDYYQKEVCR